MEIIVTTKNGVTKLEAPQGYRLTRRTDNPDDERSYSTVAYLAADDAAESWEAIEQEFAESSQPLD